MTMKEVVRRRPPSTTTAATTSGADGCEISTGNKLKVSLFHESKKKKGRQVEHKWIILCGGLFLALMLFIWSWLNKGPASTKGSDLKGPKTKDGDMLSAAISYNNKNEHPTKHKQQQDANAILRSFATTRSSKRFPKTINDNNNNEEDDKILALIYPPGLMGGYRNQVIRFLSFVVYAKNHDMKSLLLPSLVWNTQLDLPPPSTNQKTEEKQGKNRKKSAQKITSGDGTVWTPIPMEFIFDIDYWNTQFADKKLLPHLVDYDESLELYWTKNVSSYLEKTMPTTTTTTSVISSLPPITRYILEHQGFFTSIAPRAASILTRQEDVNLRWLDLGQQVQKHLNQQDTTTNIASRDASPVVFLNPTLRFNVYGGGTGAGRLWNDYIKMRGPKRNPRDIEDNLDATLLQAIRPHAKWRQLALQCIQHYIVTRQEEEEEQKATQQKSPSYVALHARMELDMMDHRCGRRMERNLTRLFDNVQDLIHNLPSAAADNKNVTAMQGVFVAVSRQGMSVKGKLYDKFKVHADENLATLNRVVGTSANVPGQGLTITTRTNIPVFECGQPWLDHAYYHRDRQEQQKQKHDVVVDFGSLLPSVMNFYIAVESSIFVGVRGSSYSTDIWTTRYHLGKGKYNYEYTADKGILPLPNGGLPPPHHSC